MSTFEALIRTIAPQRKVYELMSLGAHIKGLQWGQESPSVTKFANRSSIVVFITSTLNNDYSIVLRLDGV